MVSKYAREESYSSHPPAPTTRLKGLLPTGFEKITELVWLARTAQNFPHVFLHATYCKARVGYQIVSQTIVVAVEMAADGRQGKSSASTSVTARTRPS